MQESLEYWSFEAERVVVEALSALEVARTERQYDGADCNHVFLNFLPTITMCRALLVPLTRSLSAALSRVPSP